MKLLDLLLPGEEATHLWCKQVAGLGPRKVRELFFAGVDLGYILHFASDSKGSTIIDLYIYIYIYLHIFLYLGRSLIMFALVHFAWLLGL